MQNTMLEYSKEILQKVSFDPELFQKELQKAVSMLMEEEAQELIIWCQKHFAYQMPMAIG